jgi:hypothetical protein
MRAAPQGGTLEQHVVDAAVASLCCRGFLHAVARSPAAVDARSVEQAIGALQSLAVESPAAAGAAADKHPEK